jgi:hypothetical protein
MPEEGTMNDRKLERERVERWGKKVRLIVTLGCSVAVLSGCDDLLDVNLPARLTDTALESPQGAQTLRNSVITEFEAAYNYIVWSNFGMEDGGEVILNSPGVDPDGFDFNTSPEYWFELLQSSRRFAYLLHDKLEKDWTAGQVPERSRYLAISSMYAGAAIGLMGGSLCEVTVDTGKLMKPNEALTLAEQWLTRAVTEVSAAGDFAMPYGIASSAKAMAHGLRAQVRWMKGDLAGAKADAEQVPQDFVARVTRDVGPQRRNKAFYDGVVARYAMLYEVNDWWSADLSKAPGSQNNPVTGKPWPAVIPFTGYPNLGILADGRAVRDDGLPIRRAGKYRTPIEDTAVPDTRVPFTVGLTNGLSLPGYLPGSKYTSESASLPLVNWKEMVLIRAEAVGGQGAIDLVNVLRDADGLPRVTYANPGNAEQIRYMIIEERRRALYLEGRFYFTKLKNLDILFFPRAQGRQFGDGEYGGAVRMIMPPSEYDLNPNLTRADRATGCSPHDTPVDF